MSASAISDGGGVGGQLAAGTSSENAARFSLSTPTDAKMFADCSSVMRDACQEERRRRRRISEDRTDGGVGQKEENPRKKRKGGRGGG